jgi:hypothetical protein
VVLPGPHLFGGRAGRTEPAKVGKPTGSGGRFRLDRLPAPVAVVFETAGCGVG